MKILIDNKTFEVEVRRAPESRRQWIWHLTQNGVAKATVQTGSDTPIMAILDDLIERVKDGGKINDDAG